MKTAPLEIISFTQWKLTIINPRVIRIISHREFHMFRFKASKVWKTIKLRVASRKEGLRERWPREGVGNSTVAGIPTISRRTSSTLSRSLSSPYFVTVFQISTVSRALSRFSFVRMLTTSESIARAATAGATAH